MRVAGAAEDRMSADSITSTSLLDAEARQQALALGGEGASEARALFAPVSAGRNPAFTAKRFFDNFPDRYRECVRMYVAGASQATVARVMGMARNEVAQIVARERASQGVEQVRADLAKRARQAAHLGVERLAELLEESDIGDLQAHHLAQVVRVCVEASELLSGRATQRHEGDGGYSPADAGRLLADLRRGYAERMAETGRAASESGRARVAAPGVAGTAAAAGAGGAGEVDPVAAAVPVVAEGAALDSGAGVESLSSNELGGAL